MAYPAARVSVEPLPHGAAHVIVKTAYGEPVACGRIELEWLTRVHSGGWSADVMLHTTCECLRAWVAPAAGGHPVIAELAAALHQLAAEMDERAAENDNTSSVWDGNEPATWREAAELVRQHAAKLGAIDKPDHWTCWCGARYPEPHNLVRHPVTP